ncbi:MAG: NAD-dependent epimerase/dehydratase family protein [Acidobacteria bacterium]|nr:NAD-dependent epimerase/dehydratase family protein [Acidobacteriota bacterium]
MSFWKGRRVLVTGGAGLIGSYVTELLVRSGARVRVADNLERGNLDNLSTCISDIEFYTVDLRDLNLCRLVTRDMDVVLHLAARTVGVGYSQLHHGEMFTSTLMTSLNVLQACVESNVRRVLVASSSCVYPDGLKGPIREDDSEHGNPEKDNEGYGWAKRMTELQVRYFQAEYNLEIAIVRPPNAYGPRYPFHLPEPHVIPALVLRVLQGENPLRVWGSGQQRRSFLHAQDAAEAILRIAANYANGLPVNVSGPDDIGIGDLARLILRLSGHNERPIVFETDRPEGAPHKAVDLSRFYEATGGFKPRISLEEGLQEVIAAADRYLAAKAEPAARGL